MRPPQAIPTPVYSNMDAELNRIAEEADRSRTDREANGVTRDAGEEPEWISISIFTDGADQVSAIVAWLDKNDTWHEIKEPGTSYTYIESAIPPSKLGELSELPAVESLSKIYRPVPMPTIPESR